MYNALQFSVMQLLNDDYTVYLANLDWLATSLKQLSFVEVA